MRTPVSKLIPAMEAALRDTGHSQDDLAKDIYFAGHFDGEGCISFQREAKSSAPGLTARVSCVFKPTMVEYVTYFGGTLKAVARTNIRSGHSHKLQWQWHLSDMAGILRFVNRVLPHAREKRNQLELAQAYLLDRLERFKKGDSSPPANVHSLVEKMSRLKQFEFMN